MRHPRCPTSLGMASPNSEPGTANDRGGLPPFQNTSKHGTIRSKYHLTKTTFTNNGTSPCGPQIISLFPPHTSIGEGGPIIPNLETAVQKARVAGNLVPTLIHGKRFLFVTGTLFATTNCGLFMKPCFRLQIERGGSRSCIGTVTQFTADHGRLGVRSFFFYACTEHLILNVLYICWHYCIFHPRTPLLFLLLHITIAEESE